MAGKFGSTEAPVSDWVACAGCRRVLYRRRLQRELGVCPECGHHHPLTAPERQRSLLDPGSVRPLALPALPAVDPLGFVDTEPYPRRVERARAATGLAEAVLCARGSVHGHPVVTAVMDFRFLGGSLGSGVGELLTLATEEALADGVPFLMVTASGGARMQEGPLALMQMAKTSAALARLDAAGVLTLSLITDPTFGGVAASFATLADVVVAERGARLGFAGPRVIEQTIRQRLPEGFQRAEALLGRGLLDGVYARPALRPALARLLSAGGAGPRPYGDAPAGGRPAAATATPGTTTPDAAPSDTAAGAPPSGTDTADRAEPTTGAGPSPRAAASPGADSEPPPDRPWWRAPVAPRAGTTVQVTDPGRLADRDPWAVVGGSRRLDRPTLLDYADRMLAGFEELRGDRMTGDCPAVVGGFGRLDGLPVLLVGHQKGHSVRDLAARNFAMAAPSGYRKAGRLMRIAAKTGTPVVTLVDTPGAHPGLEAEERGQAMAIAENLRLMSTLPVPVVCAVIGEGGSGGALGLAVADHLLICENATFSVISPEGCAAILWKDPAAAPRAADALGLVPGELLRHGVVDGVVPEPPGGAHRDHDRAAALLGAALREALAACLPLPREELLRRRRERLRHTSTVAGAPLSAGPAGPGRPWAAERSTGGGRPAGRERVSPPAARAGTSREVPCSPRS